MTTTITGGRPVVMAAADLRVERSGIRFHNVAPDQVLVSVEVQNRGRGPSRPTRMKVEAAPFGAFLPWKPLTTLTVPPLRPGASTRVETTVRQSRPGALPGAEGLDPRRLLTAREADKGDAAITAAISMGKLMRGLMLLITRRSTRGLRGCLPPDLHEQLAGARPHWAGNLNVWVQSRPVERHRAPRLRVHAGRANLALFCIGGHDDYAFRVEDEGLGWAHWIFDPLRGGLLETRRDRHSDGPWHSYRGLETGPLFLVLRPPADCARGQIDVCVTQRSTGRTAHVEFDLDPSARGPGCYQV